LPTRARNRKRFSHLNAVKKFEIQNTVPKFYPETSCGWNYESLKSGIKIPDIGFRIFRIKSGFRSKNPDFKPGI
jgi:hypothetical protein